MARYNQPSRQLPQLPADVLPRVLGFLPLQQRLGSCSRVCKAWRAAAAAATHEIILPTLRQQPTADALCAWLQQHGSQAVTRLEIKAPDYLKDYYNPLVIRLPLPWQQLTQLQHLKLEGGPGLLLGLQGATAAATQHQQQQQPAAVGSSYRVMTRRAAAAAAAAGPAAVTIEDSSGVTVGALTALTSLKLYCNLAISTSPTRWISSQLQHLTQLRSLELFSLGRVGSSYYEHPLEDNAVLGDAIGQLLLLTSLKLAAAFDGRVLSAGSKLSQLQELHISNVGSTEQPLQLQNLPCSLTYLCLDEGVLDCRTDSSWQMPKLLQLKVSEWHGAGFTPQVTARMPQLQLLELSVEASSLNPAWGLNEVVAVLPELQHLQRLDLYGLTSWPAIEAAADAALAAGAVAAKAEADAVEAAAAASCAALTASTQLTLLRLEDCWLPQGTAHHMFPADRRLPFLQVLDISCSEHHLQEVDFHADQQDHNEVSTRSLVIKPRQLPQMVGCCPNLQELSLLWAGSGVGSGEMTHLLALRKLTKLSIGGCDWNDNAAEEVLAQLTGLQELCITAASKLTAGGLACLTALSKLTRLAVWGSKISFSSTHNFKNDNSDSGSDSDGEEPEYQDVTLTNQGHCLPVYLQLADKCRSSFKGLAMMCRHAQEQAEETRWQLSQKEEALQYHLAHLQAVKRELVDSRIELAAAQQQLQQQEQQLQEQEKLLQQQGQQLQELQELRRMRDAIMAVVQQQHQPQQQLRQQLPG